MSVIDLLNDYALDDLDCLIILAITDNGNDEETIKKTVLHNAHLFRIPVEREDIEERLCLHNANIFFYKDGEKYILTDKGKIIYDYLSEVVKTWMKKT